MSYFKSKMHQIRLWLEEKGRRGREEGGEGEDVGREEGVDIDL